VLEKGRPAKRIATTGTALNSSAKMPSNGAPTYVTLKMIADHF
jgi:hypothetical protein